MPWLSVPFEGKTRGTAAQLLGVSALPTLLVFDENQQLITSNGRPEIIKDQKGEGFPWYPKVRLGVGAGGGGGGVYSFVGNFAVLGPRSSSHSTQSRSQIKPKASPDWL